ncbi:SMP-30/gluconolactonase/LRE family protein [Sphingobacterium suaedae]|uniref:SMP-30/gluconolactonase/LRE family protein n=1 Tax=Sphingobacterium suaedae TaxID=1686402 RepID=A0ABW5KM34_9SPHI
MKYVLLMVGIWASLAVEAQKKGELLLVGEHFSFTEGPAADADGNIFFTDQPNNRIWTYTTKGELALFLEPAGRSNGLYFDNEGALIACADEDNQLWRISTETKKNTVLFRHFEGKLLNGPNDIWVSGSGIMYLTDPYYQRSYWQRGGSELPNALYRYVRGRLEQVDQDFVRPNGIVGSPDGKLLYVADIGADKTFVYDLSETGILSNRRLFCARGSDGMTVDKYGNVYLTGQGVFVYNASGELIHHLEIPATWTANVCFGGKEREYLFITASDKVFKIYPTWW